MVTSLFGTAIVVSIAALRTCPTTLPHRAADVKWPDSLYGDSRVREDLAQAPEVTLSEREEEVEPLAGVPAVERVVTEEDGRTFRCRALVAYLDSEVYDLDGVTVGFSNPVPVRGISNQVIGFANLWVDGGRILADASIEYASEERLLAETQSQRLYARPYGRLAVDPMPVFEFHARLPVRSLVVDGLQLLPDVPADARAVPFGVPVA